MSNRSSEQLKNDIVKDIQATFSELWEKGLVRDTQGPSEKKCGANAYEISFPEKGDANCIMFDKHVSADTVINRLLAELQYTVLMYDKAIIQAEFCVENGEISKERLVFLKKHNRILDKMEIEAADEMDEDWFSNDESIATILRIDYDPLNHVECEHPAAHLTLSNNESCRIPIQDAVTFSEFIRFILKHFYGINLEKKPFWLDKESTITDMERKMIHVGWNR